MRAFIKYLILCWVIGGSGLTFLPAQVSPEQKDAYCKALFARDSAQIFALIQAGVDPNTQCYYTTSRVKGIRRIPIVDHFVERVFHTQKKYKTFEHETNLLMESIRFHKPAWLERVLSSDSVCTDCAVDNKNPIVLALEEKAKLHRSKRDEKDIDRIVQQLLSRAHMQGVSPYVYLAVETGDYDLVKQLLTAGASPDYIKPENRSPKIALFHAQDDPTMVDLLIRAGSDPRWAESPYKPYLNELLQNGDTLSFLAIPQKSPLDMPDIVYLRAAMEENKLELLRHLLKQGFQAIPPRAIYKQTAFDIALIEENKEAIALLTEYVGTPTYYTKPQVPKMSFAFYQYLRSISAIEPIDISYGQVRDIAKASDFAWLKYYLEEGGDPNVEVLFSKSLLMTCIEMPQFVTLLLSHGADPNQSSGMNKGTPLYQAIQNEDLEVIQLLVGAGADINQEIGKTFHKNHTPLQEAIEKGNLEITKYILQAGGQLSGGQSPLFVASEEGDSRLARFFMDLGVSVNEAFAGYTPLLKAAQEDHLDLIRLLVDHGAELNAQISYSKETALILALKNKNLEACQFLIQAGADVNLADTFGYTPLMRSVKLIQIDIMRLLLEAGADKSIQNRRNKRRTAYDYAAEHSKLKHHPDILEMLRVVE